MNPGDVERELAPLRAIVRDQMLVTLMRRALNGQPGELRVPAAELDDNGPWLLDVEVQGREFLFKLRKKS